VGSFAGKSTSISIYQIMLIIINSTSVDFGTWRPNILIVMTLIGIGISFAWLDVHTSDKWMVGTGLYIVGCE
jgi:hypothetical protein